ncbi:cytochrome P450 82A3 [Artemisia annua]|uniref:Cytochrome P450 82A3 n=1 Tax=Artemisia annua TaxID=35608 RepID=A0A2U1NBN3_ARTAN|nr:cytochrome P450 82A3 [Artemisia annua]
MDDAVLSVLEDASEQEYLGFNYDTVIKAILIEILDTTPVTLTWALSLLLNNPKALKTVQEKVDVHVGNERLIEKSDIKNLVYLKLSSKKFFAYIPLHKFQLFTSLWMIV